MLTKNAEAMLGRIIKVYVEATNRENPPLLPEWIYEQEQLDQIQDKLNHLKFASVCQELQDADKITYDTASGVVYKIVLCNQTIAEYEHRFRLALQSLGGLVGKIASLADLATQFPEILETITSLRDTNQ